MIGFSVSIHNEIQTIDSYMLCLQFIKHRAKRLGKSTKEKIPKRLKKVFENRDSTEKDFYKCHALVLYVLKIKVARQKLRHLSENVKTSMDRRLNLMRKPFDWLEKTETLKYIPKQDFWLCN